MNFISTGHRMYLIFNTIALTLLSFVCIFPILHVLAISFSSKAAVNGGLVTLWPVDFSLSSYSYVFENKEFLTSFLISLERVALGVFLNVSLAVLVAYPLSKEATDFPSRTWYAWFFVFTILFSGGLIPSFLIVKETGLIDSIWALLLPGAIPVFNMLLIMNYLRTLPKALEESAHIDGAGHFRTLWSIYLPLTMPSLATIALFSLVWHWNSWFDGMIYMNRTEHYPLSTYLQSWLSMMNLSQMNMSLEQARLLEHVSNRSARAAQIFIASVPILLIYPFFQRYFVKGLVIGSVKG
ncbi:putative aldouronate transport system permease protein [Paenibacillus sp. JGP012]|jgi:putative aldouronate transport system permease protein|uniref:Carbohydrate ABC transporter permease n=1 Tax=Paenibacillus silvae TaxID=1325358 RepID=A0A2W6NDT9_9BACL|nr:MULTISPECIES: carbohydrate ABC transporter permease [Paenibacillus]MBB6021456.1 putative aldouronate transport system permease protein [Paenibacillus sp. JGP012]MBU5352191.1 carbohydrate ABC transporter permease [Paenibacillus barcinonensis]PZT54102.1 carbohydrate ABC transporter permease [Paenibacillus silvae]